MKPRRPLPKGKPLERTTELNPGKPLQRTGGLRSSGPTKARKPATWTPKQREDRDLVKARSGGVCERCGAARGTNIHHRRPRKAGGSRLPDTNQPQNLIMLCGSATTGCHGAIEGDREHSYSMGWLVRDRVDPAAMPVLRRGEWVLLHRDGTYTAVMGGAA